MPATGELRQPSAERPSAVAGALDEPVEYRCRRPEVDKRISAVQDLHESETRLCMMGPAGALFETDYLDRIDGERQLTVTWYNADASGFMDAANGDFILSARRCGATG